MSQPNNQRIIAQELILDQDEDYPGFYVDERGNLRPQMELDDDRTLSPPSSPELMTIEQRRSTVQDVPWMRLRRPPPPSIPRDDSGLPRGFMGQQRMSKPS
jgi:hypothetical protein